MGTLRHSKGEWAGQPLMLAPWQRALTERLFGTLGADGRRVYRTCYCELPRKSGKSTMASAIALYMLVGDGEPGAEVYLAAVDRDQAALVFDVAREIVRQSPPLAARLEVVASMRRIVDRATASVLRVIASDAAGSHGFNASCVIADEVHAWPNRELWDVLATSTGARRQPLLLGITTAGWERESLAGQLHGYAEGVRDGTVTDPSFLGVLYGAPADAPWDDPATWRLANPSLGITISEAYLAGEAARAKAVPAYESAFRRLHLCQWVNLETRWLPLAAWDACAGEVSADDLPEALAGATCFGGLDLSATTDLTALVLAFPRADGTVAVVPRFWLPAEGLRERILRDRVPYDVWARNGYLELTPGTVVDYAYVRAEIGRLRERYDFRAVAYDRWAATQLVQELQGDGLDVVPLGQGMASMAAPTRELLGLTLGGKIAHGNHPVLRWQADNLAVVQDAAGNVKPAKHKSRARIDGMVALVMALDQVSRSGEVGSVYETRELLVL